jgi:maltose/moltooligosaccharide transporter
MSQSAEIVPPEPTHGLPPRLTWSVGTLTYSPGRLVGVFSWMLWGDLCIVIGEAVVLRLVPLQLQSAGASNATIGIITGSVYSAMNWVMNPLISTASDRYRSRLGRRMPFLLFAAPFVATALAAFGFAGEIGAAAHRHAPAVSALVARVAGAVLPGCGGLAEPARVTIATIAVLMVLFRFFDLFPQCVYYYLFADVIPQRVMGTFICLFGVTSAAGTILFHRFLLPHAVGHPRLMYGSAGGLFLLTFTLLPLALREGAYPPPPARASRGRPLRAVWGWGREVFTTPFYWGYFLTNSAYRWAYIPFNTFLIVYAGRVLNLDAGAFGHLMAAVLLVQTPALFLLGPLLDRFHPTRVAIVGFALLAASATVGFLVIHDRTTFIGCIVATFLSVAVIQSSLQTLGPRLLPVARYGQFSAANSMVSETGMLVLAVACGTVLDHLGQRYLFAWLATFATVGLVVITGLYGAWLARGGDAAYVPPAVLPGGRAVPAGFEVIGPAAACDVP